MCDCEERWRRALEAVPSRLLLICSRVVDAVRARSPLCFPPPQSEPPELQKVPEKDRVGVTAVIVTSSYRDKEWLRVGYYVNNELKDMPKEGLPEGFEIPVPQDPTLLSRNVLVDQPRVRRFHIDWN